MPMKLNCILLIDDDESTNFLNKLVLEQIGCANEIVAVQGAREGLNFLSEKRNGKFPQPDLVFLDINMPGMNGWEFLVEYGKLPEEQKANIIVVMLTTSLNPDDAAKAEGFKEINDFQIKPITPEMMEGILARNF